MMKYTYTDFVTGKQRYTRGKFIEWTKPTGLLNARFAHFWIGKSSLFVPEYLLSKESKEVIRGKEAKANGRRI